MFERLSETTAIVTGGTSGIGFETAALFAEQGVHAIVINGRNRERGETACHEILRRAPAARVGFVPAEVTSPEGASDLIHRASEIFGGSIGILINSAGGDYAPELFQRTAITDLESIVRHWLMGTMYCCHAALPVMPRGGAIVNVASDAAKVPTPGEAVIGAALAGIVMFSRALAMEVKRQGIRVNAVTPSLVQGTRSYARLTAGGFSAKLFEKAAAAAHLGVPTARDVAELIVFLGSPRASRVTGQAISVNGGISAG